MVTSPGEPSKNVNLDEELIAMLKYLRLGRLLSHWDETLQAARKGPYSAERLLKYVLEEEYRAKPTNATRRCPNARLLRRQRANIPEMLEIETFPFSRQPKLDRKKIMSYYDSFDYMLKQRNMVWLGPTGCGKSALGHGLPAASDRSGPAGLLRDVPRVAPRAVPVAGRPQRPESPQALSLLRLPGDRRAPPAGWSGYVQVEAAQVAQFFTLMPKRHKKKTTLITTNLGFAEWGSFLQNKHLTAADPPSVCARRSADRDHAHHQHEGLRELARQARPVA